jgi:hypothetical protein
MSERFHIEIPRWDEFQHYTKRDGKPVKRPTWIKNYTQQLDDPRYLELTPHQRGLLHDLRLIYARGAREIADNTATLGRRLGYRVTRASLDALNQAGFIQITARGTARGTASLEEEKKRKTLGKGSSGPVENLHELIFGVGGEVVDITEAPRKKRNPDSRFRAGDGTAGYTGCKQTRGQGGIGYVYDPLGIDFPPADWPHVKPTAVEIAKALEQRRAA